MTKDACPVCGQPYITKNKHKSGEKPNELRDDYTSCKQMNPTGGYTEYVHQRETRHVSHVRAVERDTEGFLHKLLQS